MKQTPMPGVTVEIVELKRIEDKAVGLTYAVANDTDKSINLNALGIRTTHGSGHAAKLVGLVDFNNGKRYGVGTAKSNCLCSAGRLDVPKRGKREFWAQFGAPPAGVEKITVIIGNVPPFYNVPMTK